MFLPVAHISSSWEDMQWPHTVLTDVQESVIQWYPLVCMGFMQMRQRIHSLIHLQRAVRAAFNEIWKTTIRPAKALQMNQLADQVINKSNTSEGLTFSSGTLNGFCTLKTNQLMKQCWKMLCYSLKMTYANVYEVMQHTLVFHTLLTTRSSRQYSAEDESVISAGKKLFLLFNVLWGEQCKCVC